MIALRTAKEWGVRPPHSFWGVPGDRWSEEDYILAQSYTLLEASRCGCGCGGWADECTNPDLQDEWNAEVGFHYRRAILENFRAENKEALKEAGSYIILKDLRKEE